MIADKALREIKAWIELRESEYAAAADWSVVLAGSDEDKVHPLVILEAVSASEHETLRGVMAPLTVEARLETIPHEDGATASATTEAEHEAMDTALHCILGDRAAVDWITGRGVVRCFDIRGVEGTMGTEDDKRVTTLEIRVTCTTF